MHEHTFLETLLEIIEIRQLRADPSAEFLQLELEVRLCFVTFTFFPQWQHESSTEEKACLSHYFPWSTWFSILQVSGHHIGMQTWTKPCFSPICCFLSVYLSPNGIRSPSFCPGPFLSSFLATVSLTPVAAQHPGKVVSSGFFGNSLPFQSAEKANSYWCTRAPRQQQINNHFWLLRAAVPLFLHRLEVLFPLLCPASVCLPGMPLLPGISLAPCAEVSWWWKVHFSVFKKAHVGFWRFLLSSFSLSFLIRSLS